MPGPTGISSIPVQVSTGTLTASLKPNASTHQSSSVRVNGVEVFVTDAQAAQIKSETAAADSAKHPENRPLLLVTRASFQAVFHTTLWANDRAVAEDAARLTGPLPPGESPVLLKFYNDRDLPLAVKGEIGIKAVKDNVAARTKNAPQGK